MKLSKRYGTNFGIYFAEDEDPLGWAAFGSFTSRNNGPFEQQIEKVNADSTKRVIERFYISYGHASIGDLVDIKLFIEGLPIWLAFELEGFSRFRGQESSTRYIDFSQQPLMPYYEYLRPWYEQKISDYVMATQRVESNLIDALPAQYMNDDSYNEAELKRAVRARTFDICRGLLPSICTTNMVWFGSVNEIRQHLSYLSNLDIPLIDEIVNALDQQYPETKPVKTVRYRQPWMSTRSTSYDHVPSESMYALRGMLDFGSLRDLRRHRVGEHKIVGRLNNSLYPWYLSMLNSHGIYLLDPLVFGEGQYLSDFPANIPPLLGTPMDIRYRCETEQAEYISALRTKTNVHATLRTMIQQQWNGYPHLAQHMDMTPDVGPFGYYLVRGKETVTIKGETA